MTSAVLAGVLAGVHSGRRRGAPVDQGLLAVFIGIRNFPAFFLGSIAEPGIYFTPAWTWWVLPTGCTVALAILGFTFLGVGLEPALNPQWRRSA